MKPRQLFSLITPPSEREIYLAQGWWVHSSPAVAIGTGVLGGPLVAIGIAGLLGLASVPTGLYLMGAALALLFGAAFKSSFAYTDAAKALWRAKLERACKAAVLEAYGRPTLGGRDRHILREWLAERRPEWLSEAQESGPG